MNFDKPQQKEFPEPESYLEISKELKDLVMEGIEDINNPEAFKKLKNLGIENPEEFINFLKSTEITIDEEENTHIKPWTNTPEGQFDIYCINLKPSSDGIHGKDTKHDIAHEFGHVIQKYLKEKNLSQITSLDKKTLELVPCMNSSLPYFEKIISDENLPFDVRNNISYMFNLSDNYPKLFENRDLKKDEQIAKDLIYFINSAGGLERLAFLRETRQDLLNHGIIKSFQEEITPIKLKQFYDTGETNRILSFLNKEEKTFIVLANLLNQTP
ncbi:MAG: hypothetical protein JJE53_01835 [Candidatus Pacebacteria bacterium]|nr:hypothetical protein [Candidatus Paceibacterota bacterium]